MPGPIALPDTFLSRWILQDPMDDLGNIAADRGWSIVGGLGDASVTLRTAAQTNNRLSTQANVVRVQNGTYTGNIFANGNKAGGYDLPTSHAMMVGLWESRAFDNIVAGTLYNNLINHSCRRLDGSKSTIQQGQGGILQNGPNFFTFPVQSYQTSNALTFGTDDTQLFQLRLIGRAAGLIDLNGLGIFGNVAPRKARFILQCDDVWKTGRVRLNAWHSKHGWQWQGSYAKGLQVQSNVVPKATLAEDVAAGRAVMLCHSDAHRTGMAAVSGVGFMTPAEWIADAQSCRADMIASGLQKISGSGYDSTLAYVTPFGRLTQEKIDIGRANGIWFISAGDASPHAGLEQFWINRWGFPVGFNLLSSTTTQEAIKNTIRLAVNSGAVVIICLHGEERRGCLSTTGTVTAGTCQVTYNGQTASLNWNSSAGAAQTALEALTSIGAGNVTVTGGPWPGTPLDVELVGSLEGRPAVLTLGTISLTGGSATSAATPGTDPAATYQQWRWLEEELILAEASGCNVGGIVNGARKDDGSVLAVMDEAVSDYGPPPTWW